MAIAIGMVEFSSIARGIYAADQMVKISEVEIVTAQTICPGKYIALVEGDVAAVQDSVHIGEKFAGEYFVDSLVIGTKCLMYSAAFFEEEEEEKDKLDAMTEEERERSLRKQEKLEKLLMTATVVISMLLAVGLFMVLPYVLASLLRKVGATETVVTLVESVVKIALFLAYMGLISRMKDIQRTFMYHGSEHKCINCIENLSLIHISEPTRRS